MQLSHKGTVGDSWMGGEATGRRVIQVGLIFLPHKWHVLAFFDGKARLERPASSSLHDSTDHLEHLLFFVVLIRPLLEKQISLQIR